MHAVFRWCTDAPSKNPVDAREPEGREARGVVLFGYFLLDKQEKVTRPRSGRNDLLCIQQFKAWEISRYARDDKSPPSPAFGNSPVTEEGKLVTSC